MAQKKSMLRIDGSDSERLWIEAAKRDPRLFERIYLENFERVYIYASRRVQTRDKAQDVTAEVFKRALANIRQFEWRGVPIAAWLYRIAANVIADSANRNTRDQNLSDSLENDTVNKNDDAEREFEEIERRVRLFRMVDKLPADQRKVILSRFVEEKSIREIADELNRSEGAIKQLQFRGLNSLRKAFGVIDE